MNVMDKVNESFERISKVASLGYGNQEKVTLLASWCAQWDEDPEYDTYVADEVNLFVDGKMLFLIPKEEKLTKPIRVIIAK